MNATQTENFEGVQFTIACRELMRAKGHLATWAEAAERQHGAGRVQSMTKAAVAASSVAEGWQGNDGRIVSQSFMASLANRSVLDAVMQTAMPIPIGVTNVQLLSGASAGIADEGATKLATRIVLTNVGAGYTKISAIVALSNELAKSDSHAANKLFAIELKNAIVGASNTAFLGALSKTPIAAGATAAASLAAGLAGVGDSDAYVVAVSPAQARELALTRPTGSTLGVTGGEYLPGVVVVPVAGLAKMVVIPASRFAIADGGTQVRESSQALVELDTAPTGGAGAVMVSMWQHNLLGVLVERSFRLAGTTSAAEVS